MGLHIKKKLKNLYVIIIFYIFNEIVMRNILSKEILFLNSSGMTNRINGLTNLDNTNHISYSRQYYNFSSSNINIITRDNLMHPIPSKGSCSKFNQHVVIKTVIRHNGNTQNKSNITKDTMFQWRYAIENNLAKLKIKVTNITDKHLFEQINVNEELLKDLKNKTDSNDVNAIIMHSPYDDYCYIIVIPISQITDDGVGYYDIFTDSLIVRHNHNLNMNDVELVHPYSYDGYLTKHSSSNNNSFTVDFYTKDDAPTTKYFNLFGSVQKINSVKNDILAPGFYIKCNHNEDELVFFKSIILPIDNELFFSTYHEAEQNLNALKIKQKELADLNIEMEKLKIEKEKIKGMADIKKSENYYRSAQVDEVVNMWKAIAAVFGVALAILALSKK